MKKNIMLALTIGFVFFQMGLSLFKINFYPFNSYQMFSSNWKSERVIAGIEVSYNDSDPQPVFKDLNIPFFQANRIYLNAFYTSKDTKLQNALCEKLLSVSGSKKVDVYGVMKKYVRNNFGRIEVSYNFKEKAKSCSI